MAFHLLFGVPIDLSAPARYKATAGLNTLPRGRPPRTSNVAGARPIPRLKATIEQELACRCLNGYGITESRAGISGVRVETTTRRYVCRTHPAGIEVRLVGGTGRR